MVQTIQERIRTTTNGIITATIENPIKGLVATIFVIVGQLSRIIRNRNLY